MKQNFLFILLAFFMFSSCTKEEEKEVIPEESIPEFSMNIQDSEWNAKTFYFDSRNPDNHVIYATNDDVTVSWIFDGNVGLKSYVLGVEEKLLLTSMLEKQQDGSILNYDILVGELVIFEYDKSMNILKGTFYFNVKANDIEKSIKNGVFYIDNFK